MLSARIYAAWNGPRKIDVEGIIVDKVINDKTKNDADIAAIKKKIANLEQQMVDAQNEIERLQKDLASYVAVIIPTRTNPLSSVR